MASSKVNSMASSKNRINASISTIVETEGNLAMHRNDEIRFICPNFSTDYIPGVLKLPREFCVENSNRIPERVLLHVPPRVVWKGLFKKDRFCIERLEKMMSCYCIKPYHVVLFEYDGGRNFYLKFFNPYGVESSYHIEDRSHAGVEMDKKFLTTSDFEDEKLCGTLSFNSYESAKGICDVVLRKRHLRKSEAYNLFKKAEWESLGIIQSMDYVKLTYKKKSWVVKLKWHSGNLYMGKMWYNFAKAGNMCRGDTIVFQKTEKPQKYMVCVFEKKLFGKCNVAGVGQNNGIMDWFKIANLEFIYTGEMEIPRVFSKIPGLRIPEDVNLVLKNGERFVAKYSSKENMLSGMKNMIRRYSIRATDVMIFSLTNSSTFVVSLFKISGMESKYIVANEDGGEGGSNVEEEDIMVTADDSGEGLEDVPNENDPNNAEHGIVDAGGVANELVSFRVVLKPSHVDKKQHGLYLPQNMYGTYKEWTASTIIRLMCDGRISFVSLLRSGRICRFGKGWSEFTTDHNLLEGQEIQLDYVDELTFEVTIGQ
ncbi:hypothetical protein DCAR_0312087 [Daucus carota subsp. sativus]|uniref:TF-B3 domain-containing protein n=1 Tax=Daucus carota subsp. sativus TaxID=79200 RepID=A0A169WAQ5_DAUCS|nr:hypothetical protein DCAR_0312087 [Daucus carota subsp. sativus]